MDFATASSAAATEALRLVSGLQQLYRERLEALSAEVRFEAAAWLRDQGRHGGGQRFGSGDNAWFNRASLNVSQVHYEDDPRRPLQSATALSCIVHPASPLAPSMHLHISLTERKDATHYWRIMADLNPALPDKAHKDAFESALRAAAPLQYAHAAEQGDKYFYIPALHRHRGVSHFYLENYASGDEAADRALAKAVASAAIECHLRLMREALAAGTPSASDHATQLAYHTLYFFQVLTLDRGTTSGLLVHDQNDLGILGSLPARIDKSLLASWQPLLPEPQDKLLQALLGALPDAAIDDAAKSALARVVREHYRSHPEALTLQAAGDTLPPTLDNHTRNQVQD